MSNEERRDSLADQAATWVPPWQRPAPDDAVDLGTQSPPQGPSRTKISEAPVADDAAGGGAGGGGADGAEVGGVEAGGGEAGGAKVGGGGDGGVEVVGAEADGVEAGGVEAGGVEVGGVEVGGAGGAEVDGVEVGGGEAGGGEAGGGEAGGEQGGGAGRKQRTGRGRAVPPPAPVLDDAELRGALEAILLVVDEPVSELTLAQVLEQPAERIGPMLDQIAAGYTSAGHGFELRRAAGGWRLYTRPEYASYVERFVLDGQSVRLTQAALETLAVVAYKQPVTRSRISAIRGVNCDGVIRTLVSRGLVEECGTESDSGAYLYRTSIMFLEKLGLNSLDDLPPLAPFLPDDVEELADATR
ncbi:SMC-Scp complex subunit ScpB [Micromonospora zingiberis]|uniref:SMC-Scp complex subunit ScpB n=1 Tax=Micromonospora zingiberis TaxID=2053011 RepID=A0A4R0G6G7_9ACTN|nr:SMC-Scp complex subunit ScpB [Micromonospora zingiberis]TCB90481.1 SMC-Scp complex subunit ScpB [Micromonospora zingiberis]